MRRDVAESSPPDPGSGPGPEQALLESLARVLRPLARLAIARRLPVAAVIELLKQAYVSEAIQAQGGTSMQQTMSRISNATGLSRREVKRLTVNEPRATRRQRSVAEELFAHWTTAREFRDRRGAPRALPRQGAGVTFETLAQSVTRDVHPRSMLDELVLLGLVEHDPEHDTVSLARDTFVPRSDAARMLGFLGANVGDHASASVENVLTDGNRHFEQAIFADELSEQSLLKTRAVIRDQWRALIDAVVPVLEKMIDDDRARNRPRNHRLRIGLYSFNEATGDTLPTQERSAPRSGSTQPSRRKPR
jgi:hypothetical protein